MIKRANLIFLTNITCEKIIDIIVKSKYQKTPCPIWGEPENEILGLSFSRLEKTPKIAKKKELLLKDALNYLSYIFLKKLAKQNKKIKSHITNEGV